MKRFAFFPGCLIPARHPAMEFAIRYTLPKLGIELVDLEGASCYLKHTICSKMRSLKLK